MKITIPDEPKKIIDMLNRFGEKAYVVGGCVRNSLLNIIVNDWDITTSAEPEIIRECFSDYKVIPTGEKYGTLSVSLGDKPYEVTTFRTDGVYVNNRKPESVSFTKSVHEDLARRDFTMNAIAYNDDEGLIDPYGGAGDINLGLIRAVGDKKLRFSQDALRILRGVRFSSVLGFNIEKETKEAMQKSLSLLNRISAERISAELKKILCGNFVNKALIGNSEVIFAFIPELSSCYKFDQKSPYHHLDVWEHTVMSVSLIEPDIVLRLTMLLHDIGKPDCFSVDENGIGHFKTHPIKSAIIARSIMERLRFDKKTIDKVCILITHHDEKIFRTQQGDDRIETKKLLCKMGEDNFLDLVKVKRADSLSKEPQIALSSQGRIDAVELLAKEIIANRECFELKSLNVNGWDLMNMGFKNEEIGRLLNNALEAVIDDKVTNNRKALIEFIQSL